VERRDGFCRRSARVTEIRPYPGDTRYGVTREGRVFRLTHIHKWPPGEAKPYLGKRGYYTVCIGGRLHFVHRVIAETFIPNPENKPEVAHGDGNRTNNTIENLRWATRAENEADRELHGRVPKGETHPTAKLTEAAVHEIARLVVGKPPRARPYHRDVAKRFGVTRECVTRIANFNRWGHVHQSR
jgi:hypothetical protein